MSRGTDKMPKWRLRERVEYTISECQATNQHYVIVFYYAGHGAIIDDVLNSVSGKPGTASVPWPAIKQELFHDPDLKKMDVVAVLDCCYSGAATRGSSSSQRTAQIIAACAAHEWANPRRHKIPFIQRIFRAVQKFKGPLAWAACSGQGLGAACLPKVRIDPNLLLNS
ncbi:uncharacterized protein N7515_006573 [Penicillium bovifimosum]|uniref:Peptidase C14 caspase domain-containing protein n=1 Tax=Penicillium bovifimosum TaxID=126998 RepID=A0A9W9L0W3_9EURO|nr:uncharacterized protein N7515_006573 [Penicillium bovifimosum]KAJ5130534.1 hypothetical protein N7515_006573 [Penicillium bovifimosum]